MALMPDTSWQQLGTEQVHEAGALMLDSAKARNRLDWSPRWSLTQALEKTVEWQRAWMAGAPMHAATLRQIAAHQEALEDGVP